MVVDKFTKFLLSIIAIFLCLNTLNPWLSPALVSAQVTSKSLNQLIGEIKAGDKGNVDKLNSIRFHKLADALETKARYEIQNLESTIFGHQKHSEKITEDAIVEIAAALRQLSHTDSQRLKLQIQNNVFR